MTGYSTHPADPPKPLLPAWAFSILIHSATISLLCMAMQQSPHGAPDAKRGSMGLVLHHASTEGTLNEGDRPEVNQTLAIAEELTPPVLLAAASSDANESASSKGDEPAKTPTPNAGTTKPAAKPATSGSKGANARTTKSGHRLGSPGGSGYAQVSVFGVQGRGSKFIYVFDRSASMEGPPLAAAKKQLLESLQSLETVHQFHIIFFNTKTQSFDISGGGHRIAFATDRNKKLAANFVGGITADGGTDRLVALRDAISFTPDVIFFLTDADDPMSASELAEIARANRKAQAAICVIEFGKKPAPVPNNFLARLANDSGGQYGYVNTTTLR